MSRRRWVRVCALSELEPGRGVAALVDGQQVAVFLLANATGEPASMLRAVDNRDPVTGANVLARGILGSTGDLDYVASPMLKHRFDLTSGRCLDGTSPGVRVWPVRVWGNTVEVLVVTPTPSDLPIGNTGATQTHCPFCALQCSMRLRPCDPMASHPEQLADLEIEADPEFPVNEGRMCVKGWASVGLLRSRDRLLKPLVRDGAGSLVAASWDLALDRIVERVLQIQHEHGRDAIGVFGSGALTNEKAYLLGKFARLALRTANIDYNGRFCMSSAAAALNQVLGIDRGLPFPVSDIADTKTLVLWGANPADTMPPLMQWVERMRAGGTLVVVDPRRTATADGADLHIQPRPGTDLALALGLIRLADRTGRCNEEFLRDRTSGWEAMRASVEPWDPAAVESVSGVSNGELHRLLDALAGAPSAMLLTGRGPEQQSKGVDTVVALIDLMLALGLVGRPASGFGCLTGQANGQGGREHGQKADQLPGYRSISDPADRAAVAGVWGVDPTQIPGPGMSAVEMLKSIDSPVGIRGMFVFGSDIALASPNAREAARRLEELEFLVVADPFLSSTAEVADVVLPVTQWAEEEGTITNLEGRVIRRRRAVPPPDAVRSDIEVLVALAQRLGEAHRFPFDSTESVFGELRHASSGGRADYSGITYDRIDNEGGVFWPCPGVGHPGTPRLLQRSIAHPDGRARMGAVTYRPPAEVPDSTYPVVLTTGRYREHYNSGSQTRRLERLRQARPEPRLEMHPDLADELGIVDGSNVAVESRRGSAEFVVQLTRDIRADTVFAPFHWGGHQCANLLTPEALDPTSRMPEFKVCAVRISSVR